MDPDEIMIFLQTEIFYFKTFPYHKRFRHKNNQLKLRSDNSDGISRCNNTRGGALSFSNQITYEGRRMCWHVYYGRPQTVMAIEIIEIYRQISLINHLVFFVHKLSVSKSGFSILFLFYVN